MGSISEWFGFGEPVTNIEVRVDEEGNPSPGILPPARSSFVNVLPKEALKVGTVYRSVSIISTMVSQMDLEVHRDGKKLKTPALILNPIDSESQSSFVQQVIWSLALWGNAYIRVYGEPVSSVEVLDPDTIVVSRDELTGKTVYWLNGKQQPANKIRHLKFERMPGALLGHGPLSGAVGELKAAVRLDEFMQTWFNVDGIPRGVISTTSNLNAAQSESFMTAWEAFLNEHKNIIMPLGMKYEALTAKPMELQFQEVAEANIRNIARIFGIPAANLLSAMEGSSMTYTNFIEANLMFLQNTLSRYLSEIEDFLSSLLPRNQTVKFDLETLMRMSPEKVWAINKIKTDIGYTSGAEMRKQEGLPELPKPEVIKPEQELQPSDALNKSKENNDK